MRNLLLVSVFACACSGGQKPETVPPELVLKADAAPAPDAAVQLPDAAPPPQTKALPPDAAPPPAPAAKPDPATKPAAPAKTATKNVKVLPKGWSEEEMREFMKKNINPALGVKCDYCHDTDDFAKDTEKKLVAREMMKMVLHINKTHFRGKTRVGCITCHNGRAEIKGS